VECILQRLRNLGPWPLTVDIIEWRFYPALIGPSVNVNWLGSGPDRRLDLDALHNADASIRAQDHSWFEPAGKNLRNTRRLRDGTLQNSVCGIA